MEYITSTYNAACAKMSIDLKFVELMADVLKIYFQKKGYSHRCETTPFPEIDV